VKTWLDVDGADLSGVNGTPTFFINGRRHYGAYDIDTLSEAVTQSAMEAGFRYTRLRFASLDANRLPPESCGSGGETELARTPAGFRPESRLAEPALARASREP
jgi:hypothetical protein